MNQPRKSNLSLKQPIFILGLMTGLLAACADPSPSGKFVSQSVSARNSGIIGGAPVEDSESPFSEKVLYLAFGVKMEKGAKGMKVKWNGHCTASAISPTIILTAAHCVVGKNLDELSIVLTKNPSTTPLRPNDWYPAAAVKVHEDYTGSDGFVNDLALIKLSRSLPQSKILKLGSEDQITLPMELFAVGYGTSTESRDEKEQSENSSILNSVQKFVTSIDPADKSFSVNQNDHKGFCSGDSGGPGLIYDSETEEYYIVGVVSNVSMKSEQRKMMDPEGRFSLCIGQGNYTNVLNPELRSWIVRNQAQLTAQK